VTGVYPSLVTTTVCSGACGKAPGDSGCRMYVPGASADLDILIELEDPTRISLLGLVNLENYLSDLLGIQVQVAIKKELKPRLSPYILREVDMV
jgi:hypothetical protein